MSEKNDITDLPLRAVVISACDTLMTYTALSKDGTRKHKCTPWFDPTSEYPVHSSE